MRPRDLCTAAYYDDVQRMKQLVSAFLRDEEAEEEASEAYEEKLDDEEDDNVGEMTGLLKQMDLQKKHRQKVAKLLETTGTLHVIETKENFGFTFRCVEDCGACTLRPQFKPSKRSSYPAAPLHWAVLGRSHDAVKFLIRSGVDIKQEVPDFPNVTAALICECNKSMETARVMARATEASVKKANEKEEKRESLVNALEELRRERERRAAREKEEEEEREEDEADDEDMADAEKSDDENIGNSDYEEALGDNQEHSGGDDE